MLNKWSNSSSPIDTAKIQFSHDEEIVEDLKTVLDDLAATMVTKIFVDKIKSDYRTADKLKVYK